MLGEEEIAAAVKVVKSHNLCSQMGNHVEHFERAFADYLGIGCADFIAGNAGASRTADQGRRQTNLVYGAQTGTLRCGRL
ncbi:MAG TPA: hypothetical protein EYP53_05835 [Candidatus Latescibacteria bacterium]|nr:hypothetical protein [Candidatus Latescibacterota bacterium]